MHKHLKYIDGNSDKFWQIEVVGNQYTVTYGKNGTSGVSQTKSFDSDELCLKTAEKLVNEKIKKGYSETGAVAIKDKIDVKTGKVTNISAILEEYDDIIKRRDVTGLLPFLIKNTKGNLEPIRKHIKKHKKYWMTFVDLSLEPGYKQVKNQWNWGTRGDSKITEIISLSAIATFDKTDILSFEEAFSVLEKARDPLILDLLLWAKPNWIEIYLLDRFKKNEWLSFDYHSLRFLEKNDFLSYNPELFALCLSRFNSWHGKVKPREFISILSDDKTAYERDVPQLYHYETNIQNSTFRENETASYREFNTWSILFLQLLTENKLDKKTFIENAILIQTKEWNNNLKLFYRKLLADINPSADDLIPFQEYIFTFFHNSNPTIVNYGSELIKKLFDHPKFKTKIYLEWLESLMMRNDCKNAVKNSLLVLEKLSKSNAKLNKQIASLIVDIFVIPDLNLQERTTKLLLKVGSEKDQILTEKLESYASYLQGSIKPLLSNFLREENFFENESLSATYQFKLQRKDYLVEKVELPKDWNDILMQIGRFISSDEVIDSEIILNIFIAQRNLFPNDYSKQLQPYLKQLEKTYFTSVLKNYVKNFLVNKIPNKNLIYKIDDKEYISLTTLKLIKPLIECTIQKNSKNSALPLLSLPTHKPHWIEPLTLLNRLIQYESANENIDMVDLSIAISRMPRENVEKAIPLLEKLNPDLKELMTYCLGCSNELKVTTNSTSLLSKLFQKATGSTQNLEKLALWAVAARTFYPNDTFNDFEKTQLKNIPFVTAPFVPKIEFKEKWNEWKNYQTKEVERSPSWIELRYPMPVEKSVPRNLIYNLDLHHKKERYSWHSEYVLSSDENTYYWNSLMPQNNDPLACLLLKNNCKTADGTNNELKGFLNVINQNGFQFSDTSLLVYACCFFQEKKEVRLLASEVLINLVEKQAIDIQAFSEKIAILVSNKYGVLLRMIDGVIALKDTSPKHNAALFLVLDGIFKRFVIKDKLPTNFKKMVENYVDVTLKTNNKPSPESVAFFEKHKDNNSLKQLIKKLPIV